MQVPCRGGGCAHNVCYVISNPEHLFAEHLFALLHYATGGVPRQGAGDICIRACGGIHSFGVVRRFWVCVSCCVCCWSLCVVGWLLGVVLHIWGWLFAERIVEHKRAGMGLSIAFPLASLLPCEQPSVSEGVSRRRRNLTMPGSTRA